MKIGPVEDALNKASSQTGTICLSLLDSENITPSSGAEIAKNAESSGVSGILIGGSTITDQTQLNLFVEQVKNKIKIPTILFPGNITGVTPLADAILFTSLLNSDNPYFITGAQALGAKAVKKHGIEALPTAYLIIGDGGTTGFIGQSRGIPPLKPEIAAMYALAAQYMGMRFLYLESGSGVTSHVPIDVITTVRKVYDGFLITGGGIRDAETAKKIAKTGTNAIVVGSLMESETYKSILPEITSVIKKTSD